MATAAPNADSMQKLSATLKAFIARKDEEFQKFGTDLATTRETLEQINNQIDKLEAENQRRFQELEVRKNRPDVTRNFTGRELTMPSEKQLAFRSFARGGWREMKPEEQRALNTTVDSKGGVLAPTETINEIMTEARKTTFFFQNARVFETSRTDLEVPTFEDPGDLSWKTGDNAKDASADYATFGKTVLRPTAPSRIIKVKRDLLNDSEFNVESFLVEQQGRQFGYIADKAFLTGSGADEPLGLLSANLDTYPATPGSGEVFSADDIAGAPYQIHAGYRTATAGYIMSRSAVRRARLLKTTDGQFLWQPSLALGQPPTLNGFNLWESEFFPDYTSSGSANDPLFVFGDLNYYAIALRTLIEVVRMDEKYLDERAVGFFFDMRADGSPVQKSAFARFGRAS